MIEQEIERRLVANLTESLSADCGGDTQIIGIWESSADKGLESSRANFITVKVYPRMYDTPTIPTCIVRADINVFSRADADSSGADYLTISEKIMSIIQSWQSDIDKVVSDFSLEGFSPAGFRIAQGDCGTDRETGTWQFSTQIEIHGVVHLV